MTGWHGRGAVREGHRDRSVRPAEVARASHIRGEDARGEGRRTGLARQARPVHVVQAGRDGGERKQPGVN